MRCHECQAPAAYAPKHGSISIGLCEEHIKQYMASLDESHSLERLEHQLTTEIT